VDKFHLDNLFLFCEKKLQADNGGGLKIYLKKLQKKNVKNLENSSLQ